MRLPISKAVNVVEAAELAAQDQVLDRLLVDHSSVFPKDEAGSLVTVQLSLHFLGILHELLAFSMHLQLRIQACMLLIFDDLGDILVVRLVVDRLRK